MSRSQFPDTVPPFGSATAEAMDALALHGYAPHRGEPNPRPLPDLAPMEGAVADMADALVATLSDTRLEPDLETLLSSLVHLFHRQMNLIGRRLDANEQAQRRSQSTQDGSEIRSVELEVLIEEGIALTETRDAYEFMRDRAADLFATHTGGVWLPRAGSRVSRRLMTAAMIDSRDFIAARLRTETGLHLPPGTRIAFAGGTAYNDHARIWAVLDRVHDRYPDMVLLHGGTSTGAERIAACWAENRSVPQIVFKPDWAQHRKAAPFRRNDAIVAAEPIGLVVFPGSGITDNLADKARKLGIPILDCR